MPSFPRSFSPAQAGAALGVSAKTLRLYEQHGLIDPDRTQAGWRTYDAKAMERGAGIVALRGLGLSLAEIARFLDGDPEVLRAGLCAHETRLHAQTQQIASALDRLRALRAELAQGRHPTSLELADLLAHRAPLGVGFALPWPWDGEWFALHDLSPLTFITGPLGSGKTRFACRLAESIPEAAFVGLDRLTDPALPQRLAADAVLADRVERRLAWLSEDGASRSDALTALVTALESTAAGVLVVDMVEEGLGANTQASLMAHLRLRGAGERVLVLMTRSTAILDPEGLFPNETVILCPANHGLPFKVTPYPGGRGYEALATCVASPEVRARSAGVVATRTSSASAAIPQTAAEFGVADC